LNEEVIAELVKSRFLPVLLYVLECCYWRHEISLPHCSTLSGETIWIC